ncbi:uncharacterized protein LOC126672278 [Mercurialis annua]|uniref:uncharacterized protein LOC126672278 n=1 Tax=Mercurialis annua TaxID=3986 RepID=UPI00215FDF25|nr:uncharacterized protein LOC126672278 [Mercurialis annua]
MRHTPNDSDIESDIDSDNEEDGSNLQTATSAEGILQHEDKGVKKPNPKKVSCREYYCYNCQIRENGNSLLLLTQRLMQQFVVDMYIKIESTRLDFLRNKQSQIRCELYQGIVDCVKSGETRGMQVGKDLILPASFIGGPRDMRRRYLDAMALVQTYGKPNLFITITCNPDWKEIKEELQLNQTAQNRPDLTSRVFRAKLQDLKDQLYKKTIFGRVAAHVHVIEFQKRGLSHAHMLIILKPGHKITSPDQFDKFVSAEIPDKYEKELHSLVAKHMMHGPCGEENKSSPCMIEGKCRFKYPRTYSSKTSQGKDGYPVYKRTNNGREVTKKYKKLDNRWVVPYNPYLLTRYDCHVNVEICSGMKAVKYLYKYIYKGHDKVAVYIAPEDKNDRGIDEIRQFQDARWVSAQEAMWRIFEFDLNEIQPAVVNLQLHLPNKQMVSYWKHQNLENLVVWDDATKTMLTQFFKKCSEDEHAEGLLYREFPQHYVWNKMYKMWERRKKGNVIGRVNAANPIEGERYYMRLLLSHVKGPKSFEDLLTVDGAKCNSFKESAIKRNLLESDQSASECMSEAVAFQMPTELRRLFAILLVYCEPTDVRQLWDDYIEDMCEDFKRLHEDSVETQISLTINSIQKHLQSMGKDIQNYDLPRIPENQAQHRSKNIREIEEELAVEIPAEDIDAANNLNREQTYAYNTILDRAKSNTSGVFFVDGPGGTGKTFLYKAILAKIRSSGMIALATATSGVAAAIMPGGRTAHSRFSIPLNATETTVCGISKQSGKAELLRRAKLIIWDEAPMAKKFAIETVDRTLRDIMSCNDPFGGKIIVFGGDFRQVLPVVPKGTREQTVTASLVRSYLWNKMEKLKLSTNMRARSDLSFSQFLLRVGNGEEPTTEEDNIRLPNKMIIPYNAKEDNETALINAVFPNLKDNSSSPEYMMNRAILATRNEFVDTLNRKMIDLFPGETQIYNSYDQAVDDTNNYYQEEFLNTLLPNGLPPHRLELKINCPIILPRNLDAANGLCNGTRMVCKKFDKNVIHAEITVGQHGGKQVLLPRIPLSPAENEGYPFHFKRKQFPITLCFAMTINKAQGQTIPNVGVYLPQDVFSHGQLYVALSRGVSASTTKILVKTDKPNKKKDTYIKNVVYKEIFNSESELVY